MKIEVSTGELLDKFSILQIKSSRIHDTEKQKNVTVEIMVLAPECELLLANTDVYKLYEELLKINTLLWDVEDSIREKERKQEFDTEFVSLARNVYFYNDTRAEIKKHINMITNSKLVEEKSYMDYTMNKTGI